MEDDLRPVPIQELRLAPDHGRQWTVEHHLPQLDSLTKVRGEVVAEHLGSALQVRGEAETIVTLCCDRCLQPYNHVLHCRVKELIWLGDDHNAPHHHATRHTGLAEQGEPPADFDDDGLSERLDPRGAFDPAQWIFEQLHLQLPLVNRCGEHCPGPALPSRHGNASATRGIDGIANKGEDPRWAALGQLLDHPTPTGPISSEPAP